MPRNKNRAAYRDLVVRRMAIHHRLSAPGFLARCFRACGLAILSRYALRFAGALIAFARDNSQRSLRDNTERMRVDCYSGRKADERPVRFRLDGREYLVEEVLDQWYGPEHAFFKIRADDGNLYILRHQTSVPDGEWDLVSFRKSG